MIANYHTHTYRCNHATGMDEDYVNHAIRGGLRILGFSDHAPCLFPSDYYPRFRMTLEQLGEYCMSVCELKRNYVNQIHIHLGLEAEYFPLCFREMMAQLRDTPMEYLLLGQHFIGRNAVEHDSHRPTDREDFLACYCDQLIEGMQTGLFTYIAHPDLMNFTGDDTVYRQHITRLCREAKACGLPLEINMMGLRAGKYYPVQRFWEVAASENCQVILGCDAHSAETVVDPVHVKIALDMVTHFGLDLVETVQLRPIR